MKIHFVIIWTLALVGIFGCNVHSGKHHDGNNVIIDDSTITVTDSTIPFIPISEVEADTMLNSDTVNMHPSERELIELSDFISGRLEQLKNNPLRQNVWGIGVLIDAVEVSLAINTPYWRNEFRKCVSNSPLIVFEGPSELKPISELIDSVTELPTVKLQPDSTRFSVDSEFATFTLINESENNIDFGVKYIIGFKNADGIWYRLPNSGIWADMGITLLPTGKYEIKVALHPKLNKNKPGIYRLYKQIRFAEEKNQVWLMTEFRLEE